MLRTRPLRGLRAAPRTTELLRVGAEHILTELTTVFEAIVTTSTPRSALKWLRKGPSTHDYWPNWPPAACPPPATRRAPAPARRRLPTRNTRGQAHLPSRDEALARTEHFLADTLASIDHDPDRRLIATFATWRVLRRLWHRAEQHPRPRG
jgi:hypothetical protein